MIERSSPRRISPHDPAPSSRAVATVTNSGIDANRRGHLSRALVALLKKEQSWRLLRSDRGHRAPYRRLPGEAEQARLGLGCVQGDRDHGAQEPSPALHTLIQPEEDRVTLASCGWLEVAVPYPDELTRELRRAAIWSDGSAQA